jgi:ribosomal protein L7Ae-like RNA K-turn-binding protein
MPKVKTEASLVLIAHNIEKIKIWLVMPELVEEHC